MQNKNITLFFDFDNTLVEAVKRITEMYNKKYNDNADWEKVYRWNLYDQCTQITEDDISEFFGSEEFFVGLDKTLLGYSYSVLRDDLKRYPHIKFGIITKGNPNNLYWKEKFINKWFSPDILKLECASTMSKHSISGEYLLIDDNEKCVLTCGCKYKLLYAPQGKREWNENVYDLPSDESDIDVIDTYYDAYKYIMYALKQDGII